MKTNSATGTLYLIPTPIGNLGDITLRSLETLKTVHIIAAEDTRTTGILLKHYDIKTKQISYHKFNEQARVQKLLSILNEGLDVAIVTDAGSPGISDPAQILVKAAIDTEINVIALPGATALIPALTASGLNSDTFTFYGFLPAKKTLRRKIISEIKENPYTSLLYETCPKLYATLKELHDLCGNRRISIAREISKLYEEHIRSDLQSLLEGEKITLKGELVLVIEGANTNIDCTPDYDDLIVERLSKGEKVSSILEHLVGNLKQNKNESYQRILELKKELK
jgi:16S rRNA (cytidine1402-2'-O)-methyltransferase